MTQPGVGFQQLLGVGLQQMPPGLGNSMDNIVAARGIFQQMNPRELQVVFQEINQRLNFQRQGGFVPERLGQARSEPDLPTFVRPEGHDTLPLVNKNLEEMSSVVVKNGLVVHPKVIMRAGGPGKMKYWE